MCPGEGDAAELDGEKQGQHKGGEEECTLEVDAAELALLQLSGMGNICLVKCAGVVGEVC